MQLKIDQKVMFANVSKCKHTKLPSNHVVGCADSTAHNETSVVGGTFPYSLASGKKTTSKRLCNCVKSASGIQGIWTVVGLNLHPNARWSTSEIVGRSPFGVVFFFHSEPSTTFAPECRKCRTAQITRNKRSQNRTTGGQRVASFVLSSFSFTHGSHIHPCAPNLPWFVSRDRRLAFAEGAGNQNAHIKRL